MLALLILLIENRDVFLNRGDTLENPVWMVYRKFLFAVVAYYITDVQRSMQAGINAHLTKPVESDQLIGTLGELVYEAQTRA